jgi:AraC-like DNA-binding protein
MTPIAGKPAGYSHVAESMFDDRGWPIGSRMQNDDRSAMFQNDVYIARETLRSFLSVEGGWQTNRLGEQYGQTAFIVGRIGTGITATHSRCRFRAAVRSTVEHPNPQTILVFGLVGRSRFDIAGNATSCMVCPGDVWLFRPTDAPIVRRTPAGEDVEMFVMKFNADRLDGLDKVTKGGARCLARNAPAARLSEVFRQNRLETCLDRLHAESCALDMLVRFLTPLHGAAVTDACVSPQERHGLSRVIDWLLADLANPPSLEQLAQAAGMSHVRLSRLFRKVYGKTVFHWLRDYRLASARCLLCGKCRWSITEVAFACGFSSSAHFAAAFREAYQCSPQDFRRANH